MRKFLFGLAPLLAVAALGVAPASSSAAACRVLKMYFKTEAPATCNEPPGVKIELAGKIGQNLRANTDGAGTTPVSTNYGTDGLAVNTVGKLRFRAKIGTLTLNNESEKGFAFFGLEISLNPESSTTVCREATGKIPWIDIQNASPSPVLALTTESWLFSITSDHTICGTRAGEVKVTNVKLLFETLQGGVAKEPVKAAGEFVGNYENSNATCPGGGVKFKVAQPGIVTEPATTSPELDNGKGTGTEAERAAWVCFVSVGDYLFPQTAPKWEPFEDINRDKEVAIWKD